MRTSPSFVPCSLLITLLLVGCGGTEAPYVDPRPLSDGGLPDRTVLEVSASDRPDGTGDDGGDEDGDQEDGADTGDSGSVTDGGRDGGDADDDPSDGSTDASPLPTTVVMEVTHPQEDAIQVLGERFAPAVRIVVTTDPARDDGVKQVEAELWSSGTTPAKISTTKLVQLSNTAPGNPDGGTAGSGGSTGSAGNSGTAGNTGTGGGAGAAGAGGGGDPGATEVDGAAGSSGDDGSAPPNPAPPAGKETVFTYGDTPIDLSALTTGRYELRVATSTLAGVTVTAVRKFRVDAGPLIRVISPTTNQAARGSIFVSVQVTDPFSTTPPTVSISVANLPVAPLVVTGDLYQATLANSIAMPSLSGEQLLDVSAVNAAGVAARHVVVRFVFDDVGPTIVNGKPATQSLVGGIIKLEVDVTDPAGVDAKTVTAVVAHGNASYEVKLNQDPNDLKHFTHLFDTRLLSTSVLYPTISFRASDLPGNQSNVGYPVAVDNTPPLADLDPPSDLRIRSYSNGNWRCSWQFDPLGSDAVNDGDRVLQLFDIRARVQDEGNSPAAGFADITPLAGLDPARVQLLVLDDTSRALVVDTDGDGTCDAVNPKLVPTTTPMSSQDALLVNLAPVPPTGAADLTADPTMPMDGFPDCTVGNDSLDPPVLCRTTDMTIAIPSRHNSEAGVWTIPKVVPGAAQCVGNQFDSLGNHLNDGPACLAVQAIDRLGNSQVSRVLHVCIDHDASGNECPFAPVSIVAGGTPVQLTTASPHGLVTGARALVGGIPSNLFDANGLWKVTVLSATTFTLDGSSTASTVISGGHFMPWTGPSDCTGRQTAMNPAVVDDTIACKPWRRYPRGEHLDIE